LLCALIGAAALVISVSFLWPVGTLPPPAAMPFVLAASRLLLRGAPDHGRGLRPLDRDCT